MTPLEAMARALCTFMQGGQDNWREYVEGATDALDALASNISEGMVEAGMDAFMQYCRYETDWQGVIEAAIKAARDDAMIQRAKEEG